MSEQRIAYLQVHIAVLLYGFTAILGHLITLDAVVLVWWRVMITSVSLIIVLWWSGKMKPIPIEKIKRFGSIGMVVGLHWICFYASIKLANASLALICLAMTSLFTSFFEPMILKTKFQKIEIFLGICIVPAMALIVSDLSSDYFVGVLVGILSAMLAAYFSVLNKKYITDHDPYIITFIELGSAALMMSVIVLILWSTTSYLTVMMPHSTMDWVYMMILSLVCTTLSFILALKGLKHISAFGYNLIFNLEPLYGVLLAILILHEHKDLSPRFFVGAFVIISTVLAYPFFINRSKKKLTLT